jgi:prepilin signal peptidase PulO-like enzyme (type II secretory pathway)
MVVAVLLVFGLVLGSFVNALVYRLHEQQLLSNKKSAAAKKQLQKLSIMKGRSMCSSCGHQLAAIDLVPVLSWLWLRGKCRYCKRKISDSSLVELIVPALFLFSYYFWSMTFRGSGLFDFILWLIFLVGFVALAVYDLRWKLLPNRIVYPLITLAVIQVLVTATFYHKGWHALLGAIWGILIAAGLFYVLFELSRGRWIGGGDVKLAVVLGILVGGPTQAVLMLFMASVLGTAFSLPLIAIGKLRRNSQVPFGPFLLFATIIAYIFGSSIIGWYKHLLVG